MFEVSGIFAEILNSDGSIERVRRKFETSLGSEDSILKFINKHSPIENLKIIDHQDCRHKHSVDRTEYFLSKVK
jgi:hypothetical protein